MITGRSNESIQTGIAGMEDNIDEDDFSLNKATKSRDESGRDVGLNDSMLRNSKRNRGQVNLDLILDVPVELEIELGRKKVLLEKVLELETGSILTLDKTADDPVSLYINGALIATGMLITVGEGDMLGFQVTNIVDRTKRIISLK